MNAELTYLWRYGVTTEELTAALMRAVPRQTKRRSVWALIAQDAFSTWVTAHDTQVYDAACEAFKRGAPTAWGMFEDANRRAVFVGDDKLMCKAIGGHLSRVMAQDVERLRDALAVCEMHAIDEVRATLRTERG